MKKFITVTLVILVVAFIGYYLFVYYVPYSTGYRSGELIKISKRGVMFKTWEGSLSQGVSDSQHFEFSVEGDEKEIIDQLITLQGKTVSLSYVERFGTFPWMGDTKYYITEVQEK